MTWNHLSLSFSASEWPSSRSQLYAFWISDIPTSQSALKQSYTEETNGQNIDDKLKKPTLGSYSIFFHVTQNKFKATLHKINLRPAECLGGRKTPPPPILLDETLQANRFFRIQLSGVMIQSISSGRSWTMFSTGTMYFSVTLKLLLSCTRHCTH